MAKVILPAMDFIWVVVMETKINKIAGKWIFGERT